MLVVLLLRLGEITIKGPRTRRRFEKLLQRNIKEALHSAGIEYTERREGGRIFIYCQNEDKALEILRRVFGIKSLSKAVEIEFTDLDDLV
ncbi:MAG: THUMP domain-containing protein, partial [Thermofilaceae archaeon]